MLKVFIFELLLLRAEGFFLGLTWPLQRRGTIHPLLFEKVDIIIIVMVEI